MKGTGTLMLAAACVAASAGAADPGLGRTYPAVNGTDIRCPVPAPPSAEQQAAQFKTAPRDLDEMSKMAKRFADPNDPLAAGFRAKQAEQRANDWPFLCRYRDANEQLKEGGTRPVAVFIGDSITEGWGFAHPAFFASHGYVDRGISGQSSPQIMARFYQDVVELHPQVVHIMTGTNDIGGATGPITENEYVGYVSAMIDMARANGIAVVLGSMPPMSRLLPRPEFDVRPEVRNMNRRLGQLAKHYGILFVDYYAPLADPEGAFDPRYANDGVHPTFAGYDIMEPLAQQAIAKALASTASPSQRPPG